MHFCKICHGSILKNQAIVRVIVESLSGENGDDVALWEDVDDWDMYVVMHRECVLKTISCKDMSFSLSSIVEGLELGDDKASDEERDIDELNNTTTNKFRLHAVK